MAVAFHFAPSAAGEVGHFHGARPLAIEISDRGVRAHHSARSYTSMSRGRPLSRQQNEAIVHDVVHAAVAAITLLATSPNSAEDRVSVFLHQCGLLLTGEMAPWAERFWMVGNWVVPSRAVQPRRAYCDTGYLLAKPWCR